jgi:hypothetical protein
VALVEKKPIARKLQLKFKKKFDNFPSNSVETDKFKKANNFSNVKNIKVRNY